MKKKIMLIASVAILAVAGAVFAFTFQNQEPAVVATPAKTDACCMSKEETAKTTAAENTTAKDACCAKK
ncbi:hypothetical protein JNL27_16790 [bacterium]|nr:hypothetical protein [bacterium]